MLILISLRTTTTTTTTNDNNDNTTEVEILGHEDPDRDERGEQRRDLQLDEDAGPLRARPAQQAQQAQPVAP